MNYRRYAAALSLPALMGHRPSGLQCTAYNDGGDSRANGLNAHCAIIHTVYIYVTTKPRPLWPNGPFGPQCGLSPPHRYGREVYKYGAKRLARIPPCLLLLPFACPIPPGRLGVADGARDEAGGPAALTLGVVADPVHCRPYGRACPAHGSLCASAHSVAPMPFLWSIIGDASYFIKHFR